MGSALYVKKNDGRNNIRLLLLTKTCLSRYFLPTRWLSCFWKRSPNDPLHPASLLLACTRLSGGGGVEDLGIVDNGGVEMTAKKAVKEYQCVGCVGGDPGCYKAGDNLACVNHCAGTMANGIGRFFLGLPKGFCRLGDGKPKIYIFKTLKKGWGYNKFNVPVWKHLDEHGNTIVRGMCPRINDTWIHIFLGDYIKDIDCLEITQKDMDEMD